MATRSRDDDISRGNGHKPGGFKLGRETGRHFDEPDSLVGEADELRRHRRRGGRQEVSADRSRWAEVMTRVPRERFIPDLIYTKGERNRHGNDFHPVSRHADPERWASLVRADAAVITQVEDGAPDPDGSGYEPTSSASAPAIVADMLTALDARPGHRVLEIGTGTGWNAALLAHTVGTTNLTTVEIDPAVADHARAALDSTGFGRVTVITGDGLDGWTAGAPYDRIIATCGLRRIPWAWIRQLCPGGLLVAPMDNLYYPLGFARLTRTPDGAIGEIVGEAAFMAARAQRTPRRRSVDWDLPTRRSTTTIHPWCWTGNVDTMVAIGQRITGVTAFWRPSDSATGTGLLKAPDDQSWATVEVTDAGKPYQVEQAGPRNLHREVRTAARWWRENNMPRQTDWRITLTPH